MASSKTKRKGKIMGRHSSKVAGNNADKPCNDASFVNGGCGVSVCTSPDLEASHKMELVIGDMTISIDADFPSPSFETSHIFDTPAASEAQNYESRDGEVECRPRFTQLDEDIDLRHNSAGESLQHRCYFLPTMLSAISLRRVVCTQRRLRVLVFNCSFYIKTWFFIFWTYPGRLKYLRNNNGLEC